MSSCRSLGVRVAVVLAHRIIPSTLRGAALKPHMIPPAHHTSPQKDLRKVLTRWVRSGINEEENFQVAVELTLKGESLALKPKGSLIRRARDKVLYNKTNIVANEGGSEAYFVHDAFDMINHERSTQTTELFLHHVVASFVLLCGILPRKFLLANYWALLQEGNSIFLHARTIMRISGLSIQHPTLHSAVVRFNIVSMVVCRFVAPALFIRWALYHVNRMHPFFACVVLGGPSIFTVINVMLFYRILIADGFLGKQWRDDSTLDKCSAGKVE
ncbi:hypothetical protein KIN20_036056 [Parelaphostrongylus tenuis]|uniref:TLC domain-containing protein n=1 Tax=Parelaphostrongylus tenuis TaxID=148309 RepID=A0AAD5RC15_PARTN|nr:hypothetical protein KIN20_036056 [Parelaphostrongylus tenuis]